MENQQKAILSAARALADAVYAGHHLVITHGNGPQVGLLALQSQAGPAGGAMPLDVLGAQSEGWIGYVLELALSNAFPEGAAVVTVLTQTLVDGNDPAFARPVKPIGPVYEEEAAQRLQALQKWPMVKDGKGWRRVVASPKPLGIVEILSIKRLINSGVTVICAGGGGIPVRAGADGKLVGVEAVVDKDLTGALLARQAEADFFVMLTDVPGVYLDYGGKEQRIIASGGPKAMLAHAAAFQAGSMGPKVEAACAFVQETGQPAAIGALADLTEIIAGRRGTQISPQGGKISFHYPDAVEPRSTNAAGGFAKLYF
ncbi:carbamate kinase [Acidocella aquatica]|uniref:Carbamate kinase n=2 Tax=Acidocella aquatica TaxID=1922313 RepID=A0ABQ6A2W1_9PROT|nr:carbamate kinase [Acidocella aquatica]